MEVSTPASSDPAVATDQPQPEVVPRHDRRRRAMISVFPYDHAEASKIRQPGESWAQFFRLLLYFYIGAQGVAHDTPRRPPI